MIFDVGTSQVKYMQATNPRDKRRKKATSLPTTDEINFHEKVSHVAWHPKNDLVAIAAGLNDAIEKLLTFCRKLHLSLSHD